MFCWTAQGQNSLFIKYSLSFFHISDVLGIVTSVLSATGLSCWEVTNSYRVIRPHYTTSKCVHSSIQWGKKW